MIFKRKFGIIAASTIMLFVFASCDGTIDPQHSHEFSKEWTSDDNYHWHAATCEHTDEVSGKAEHTWDNGEETTAATEKTEGVKTFKCTICGKTRTEVIPTLEHEHTIDEAWTSNDEKHWHAASCGIDSHNTNNANHDWDDGKTTKEPTCAAEGETTYTCTICEKTKSNPIPKLAHTYSEEWTSDDNNHWHAATCEHTDEVSGKAEHTWDNGEETTAATEKTEGVKTFKCTTCGKTRTEVIPTLEHEHTIDEAWTSNDEKHWHAASCGIDSHNTNNANHDWDDGKTTKEPTCAAEGETTYTCTICEKTKKEPIEKLTEHTWDDGKVAKTPTVESEGLWEYECKICKETKTEPLVIYTVEYLFQNISDDNYTKDDSKTKTGFGKIGGETDLPETDTVEGFEEPVITQITITKDVKQNVATVKYARKISTLTFDLAGGKTTTTLDENKITGKYGAPVEFAAPTKKGYTLADWKNKANEAVTLPSTFPAENAEYTASWNANTYIVKFNSNGGTGTMSDQTFTYDTPGKLTANVFEKEGYKFIGWATSANGTKTYSDNDEVENLAESGEVNLYAIWKVPAEITATLTPSPANDIGTITYTVDAFTITLTAPDEYEKYTWFIANKKQDETTNTLQIKMSDYLDGEYLLMLIVDDKLSATYHLEINK